MSHVLGEGEESTTINPEPALAEFVIEDVEVKGVEADKDEGGGEG